jgi:hypothetical protein
MGQGLQSVYQALRQLPRIFRAVAVALVDAEVKQGSKDSIRNRRPSSTSNIPAAIWTGWISSVFNMASGVAAFCGGGQIAGVRMPWEDRRLLYVVREPFLSRHSQVGIVAGTLDVGEELVLESLMPSGGAIFSDGMEADYLQFNSGAIARMQAAEQRARLVVS